MFDMIEQYIWGTVYFFLYFVVLMSIPLLAFGLLSFFLGNFPANLQTILKIIIFVFLALLFIVVIFLSNKAGESKMIKNMSFWDAHLVAWEALLVGLTFIPIIGKIFESRSEE
jgi:hypothetical protein